MLDSVEMLVDKRESHACDKRVVCEQEALGTVQLPKVVS